jgi:hypothetical protein
MRLRAEGFARWEIRAMNTYIRSRCYGALFLLPLLIGASFPTPQEELPVQLQAAQRGALPLDGGLYALAFTADANDIACVSLLKMRKDMIQRRNRRCLC